MMPDASPPSASAPPPATLSFVTGDVTRPVADAHGRPIIVAHCCNDAGHFGSGVAGAIASRWPVVRGQFKAWHRGTLGGAPLALGNCQVVRVGDALWVANLVGQAGIRSARRPDAPIRYDALAQALGKLARAAHKHGAVVHCPRLGTERAGGDWRRIEALLQEQLVAHGVSVVVYDWEGAV